MSAVAEGITNPPIDELLARVRSAGQDWVQDFSGAGHYSLARMAEVSVDDDGPGIEEGKREEAFRPFHRLDEGRNLQTGGVGLGLAIARDLALAGREVIVLEAEDLSFDRSPSSASG